MSPDLVIEVAREALYCALTLAAPPLCVALLVGTLVGLLQALTQVHDSTISLVPKIVAVLVALAICAPWMLDQIMDFSQHMFSSATPVVSDLVSGG